MTQTMPNQKILRKTGISKKKKKKKKKKKTTTKKKQQKNNDFLPHNELFQQYQKIPFLKETILCHNKTMQTQPSFE